MYGSRPARALSHGPSPSAALRRRKRLFHRIAAAHHAPYRPARLSAKVRNLRSVREPSLNKFFVSSLYIPPQKAATEINGSPASGPDSCRCDTAKTARPLPGPRRFRPAGPPYSFPQRAVQIAVRCSPLPGARPRSLSISPPRAVQTSARPSRRRVAARIFSRRPAVM